MTDRDRLIEFLHIAPLEYAKKEKNDTRMFVEFYADYLLANGVIVPPCKVGDRLFCVITDSGINKTYTHIEACKVADITYFTNDSFVIGVREINRPYSHNVVLGKGAFNTFEEAEAKLKEHKKMSNKLTDVTDNNVEKISDNEIIKASENTEVKKIKAIYPHIVVGGTADKPCYSIDWYNIETKTMHTGYSSYNLKIVQEWLKEYFEVVEDDIENLINRLQEKLATYESRNKALRTERNRLNKEIKTAKVKAIKEFAKRVPKYANPHNWDIKKDYVIYKYDFEKTLKEMVGEK